MRFGLTVVAFAASLLATASVHAQVEIDEDAETSANDTHNSARPSRVRRDIRRDSPVLEILREIDRKDEESRIGQRSIIEDIKDVIAGRASPEVRRRIIEGVRNNTITMPEHLYKKLPKDAFPPPRIVTAQEIMQYQSGRMDPQDMIYLDDDIAEGRAKLPAGKRQLERPPNLGFVGSLVESVTGANRSTADTRRLPDWAGIPEMSQITIVGATAGIGMLFTNADETAQIVKAQFPNVKIRQDEKGNYIFKSAIDGKEYAYKPGFQVSDIPLAGAGIAALTLAGKALRRRGSRRRCRTNPMVQTLTGTERAAALARVPGWTDMRDAIERDFVFADFSAAFAFMTQVAALADAADHHPEWRNVYNRVHVRLTTHDAGGLSMRDIDLAMKIDAIGAVAG